MTALDHIKKNLKDFVKSYYTAQLIKGCILFLALGSLFLLLVLGVEYFLWLSSGFRLCILLSMLLVSLYLAYQFILIPIFYLFRLKKGLSDSQAADLIGRHFPEIEDKLSNLIDLQATTEQSELLSASIQQRAEVLTPFNFSKAINFNNSYAYAKWIVAPLLIFSLIFFFGDIKSFFKSYERVVNYDLAYEKPAPFKFILLSSNLSVLKNETASILVETSGTIQPETISISIEGEEYVMKNANGIFQYDIKAPTDSFTFHFIANGYTSNSYRFEVINTPSILNFNLELNYPKYTNKKPEVIQSTGTAILLEGTTVKWNVTTEYTDKLLYKDLDTIKEFTKISSHNFIFSKRIYNSLSYTVTTSNERVLDFENLNYSFKVVKDEAPRIEVEQRVDSLVNNTAYYSGTLSDDYGLTSLKLFYYDMLSPDKVNSIELSKPTNTVNTFYYTFPSGIDISANSTYGYYFQVSDNDGVNGSKHTKSKTFTSKILNDNQLKNKDLESQQAIISNLNKTVDQLKNQTKSLEDLSNSQKEKSNLNFNDKSKLNSLLQKQEVQENQMQKFSKQLKENLSKSNEEDDLNKLLQERLERQELQAEKNKQLLEDLKKIADKINKEELSRRLDDLAKNQKNGQRNLEQLLELTKRYYVTEAASQLAKDLENLSKKQEDLSQSKTNDTKAKEAQEKVNEEFSKLSSKLKELEKDNENLKKPISLGIKDAELNALDDNLDAISKQLQEEQKEIKSPSASSKQKSAAAKIKELAESLSQSSSSSGGSSVSEDAEVLRQILDNLVVFTFKQEAIIDELSENENVFANQSKVILQQKELKSLFEHVDDSLFSLSLRVPEISEKVNKEVTDLYYNLDNVVENLSESRIYQSVSYQKYVLNSGNTLSDLLADILDNMQESMKTGKGEGSSQDFQLPDIIKGQSELSKKMGDAGKGKEGKKGESGSSGEKGKEGNQGKQGENGSSDSDGQKGSKGKSGTSGENSQGQQGTSSGSDAKGEGKSGQGRGDANGSGEKGSMGNGNTGLSEGALKEIYQIYKEQELLKNKLEEQLSNMINSDDRRLGEKLIKQMNDFQNNLLEDGITRSSIDKATIIQYELLKLEGAAMKQGEKKERESDVNSKSFSNPILSQPEIFENYKNQNEILNRQALPLRQNYQHKIKEYFNTND
ncbi:hypothetical protein [Cellulophaga sp. Z1A5H]|uniref:hypothetical protein n=1 Tax=Cellulophaga sp. Z1A5H TaxID=2687291 RepID=UPI0013FD5D2B|nr:hypothetical protein [Cellulophaga sp. Z1A5H]